MNKVCRILKSEYYDGINQRPGIKTLLTLIEGYQKKEIKTLLPYSNYLVYRSVSSPTEMKVFPRRITVNGVTFK